MKIQVLRTIGRNLKEEFSARGLFLGDAKEGEIVTFEDPVGEALIKRGMAVLVEESPRRAYKRKPKPPAEPAAKPQEEKQDG